MWGYPCRKGRAEGPTSDVGDGPRVHACGTHAIRLALDRAALRGQDVAGIRKLGREERHANVPEGTREILPSMVRYLLTIREDATAGRSPGRLTPTGEGTQPSHKTRCPHARSGTRARTCSPTPAPRRGPCHAMATAPRDRVAQTPPNNPTTPCERLPARPVGSPCPRRSAVGAGRAGPPLHPAGHRPRGRRERSTPLTDELLRSGVARSKRS